MINNQQDQGLTSDKRGNKDPKDASKNGLKFGSDVVDTATSAMGQFGETAQKLTSDIGHRLSTTSKDVTAWTKENPVKAALIGAGAGFVIGSAVRGMLRSKH